MSSTHHVPGRVDTVSSVLDAIGDTPLLDLGGIRVIGAHLVAARRLSAEGLERVATICRDEGEKYLTDYFLGDAAMTSHTELDTRV